MKTRLYLLILLLIPAYLLAQPTIESAVPFTDNTDGTVYTTGAITVPSVSNLGIAICVTSGEPVADAPLTGAPTYSLGGGQVFSEIITTGDGTATEDLVSIWYLVNPTVGTTGTITWTHAGTVTSSVATILVLSGAAQSNPTIVAADPTSAGASHAGPWSVDLTTTVNNSLLITCNEFGNGSIEVAPGVGQDEVFDLTANGQRHGSSTEVKVTAGLETLTSNSESGTPTGRFAAIAVAPAAASPSAERRRSAPISFR